MSHKNKILKIAVGSLIGLALFFGVNFSWSHAALAWVTTKADCPEDLVLQAKIDALSLFNGYSATPVWLCLKKPVLGLDVSHGATRFAPFLPSIIVIGPKGMTRDVMAHEYAHAELAARTSALARTYLVPTWFDEGLAMQLDRRKDYSSKSLAKYLKRSRLKKPRLDELGWPGDFFASGEQGKLHYAFARCVVKRWRKSQGIKQPLKLINGLGWLKWFPQEQFKPFEQACLKV